MAANPGSREGLVGFLALVRYATSLDAVRCRKPHGKRRKVKPESEVLGNVVTNDFRRGTGVVSRGRPVTGHFR